MQKQKIKMSFLLDKGGSKMDKSKQEVLKFKNKVKIQFKDIRRKSKNFVKGIKKSGKK